MKKLEHQISCIFVHRFRKRSMFLIFPWGGTSFYPNRFACHQSWKIRVSLSNPRSMKSNFPEKLCSKHPIEAISLVSSLYFHLRFSVLSRWQTIPRLRMILKDLITYEHGSIECFSYLKKHDLENYVKEEATDVDVFVTSECIHLCILCLVTRCWFRVVSIM